MFGWLFLWQNVRIVNLSITQDYLFPSLSFNVSRSSGNANSNLASVTSNFGLGLHQFECTATQSLRFLQNMILRVFLVHLSRRHIGELIVYPCSGVRRRRCRCRCRRRPPFSNVFSSETTWPIKVKIYVEPSWEGGTKVCINSPGHMTKMAAMPIYGKNLKTLLLQNRQADFHETWYVASGTPAHHSLYK